MGLVPVPLLLGTEGKLFSFNKSWLGFAGLPHACSTEIGIFAFLQASAYEILLVILLLIISASFCTEDRSCQQQSGFRHN